MTFELDRRHGDVFGDALASALRLLSEGIIEHGGIKRKGQCTFTTSEMKLKWEITEEETRQ